jgi:multidrug efflux pump subunit AcrB
VALTASFLVAIFLTPYLSFHFLKKGLHQKNKKSSKRSVLDRVQDGFNKALEFCFKWPKTTMSMGIVSLVLAVVVASHLKQELFPYEDRNQFNMEIWMPDGTSLEGTAKAVNKVEAAIKGDKRIVSTASFVGTSSPRFHYSYAPETPRENYAQIFINTQSEEATAELIHEYLEKFKNFLPDGYVHTRAGRNKNCR